MRRPGRTASHAGGVLAGALCLLVLPATGAADPISGLREKAADLVVRQRMALLDLYALESRLGRARGDLAEVPARIATLERERAAVHLRLLMARRTLATAERRLGEQLRALYVQDQPEPIAIVLGATSLEEVITGLDSLSRAARAGSEVVEELRTARDRVARLSRSLDVRRKALGRLRAAAAGSASFLASALAEREAYIARLRAERRLTTQQIASLEARVRAAQARAELETVRAESAGSVASFGAQAPTVADQVTVVSTGYALRGTTATGLPVGPGIVAVDPTVIPLGTPMTIPGYGEGVAADTGSAIRGLRIDVWFPTRRQALAWGWRTVTIVLH